MVKPPYDWPGLVTRDILFTISFSLSPGPGARRTSGDISVIDAEFRENFVMLLGHIVLKIALSLTTGLKVCGLVFQPIRLCH